MLMNVNGLSAEINMPAAPTGGGTHVLPPYDRQDVYVVDEYPACPSNWMHGSDRAASYFLPVKPGKHLWIDFNQNRHHNHHVAIVASIQGINPITGLQTKQLRLEQYRKNCPVHGCEFGQDRYCEQCGYQWPSQNYMTTASTPPGQFWIDGFRTQKGEVRGFLITEETMRGVATQIIGDDRVFAIGIAFYLSKEPKPEPSPTLGSMTRGVHIAPKWGSQIGYRHYKLTARGVSVNHHSRIDTTSLGDHAVTNDAAISSSTCSAAPTTPATSHPIPDELAPDEQLLEVNHLEIAAGAKIRQELAYHDPSDPDFYQDEPAGVIYCNYCTQGDFEKIIAAGKRDLTKGGEGFLAGLKTGN